MPRTIHLDVVDSTSSWIRRNARSLPPGTVVSADYQTAGRGRGDRRWFSPPGGAAMFSILWPKGGAPREALARLSVDLARLVAGWLSENYGIDTELKPPNDVLSGGSKLCGILVEECGDSLIIGIGINTNLDPNALPGGIKATSLAKLCGSKIENRRLIERLASVISDYLGAFPARLEGENN